MCLLCSKINNFPVVVFILRHAIWDEHGRTDRQSDATDNYIDFCNYSFCYYYYCHQRGCRQSEVLLHVNAIANWAKKNVKLRNWCKRRAPALSFVSGSHTPSRHETLLWKLRIFCLPYKLNICREFAPCHLLLLLQILAPAYWNSSSYTFLQCFMTHLPPERKTCIDTLHQNGLSPSKKYISITEVVTVL